MTVAPSSTSRSTRAEACARARVTITRQPESGRRARVTALRQLPRGSRRPHSRRGSTRQLEAHLERIGATVPASQHDESVQARDEAFQLHRTVRADHPVGADRKVAASTQLTKEGALGVEAPVRGFIVDRADHLPGRVVVHPALDREPAPWPTWGSIVEIGRTSVASSVRPSRSSAAEHDHDGPFGRHLVEAGGDVAPQLLETKVRSHPSQLRPPSRPRPFAEHVLRGRDRPTTAPRAASLRWPASARR